MKFKTTATKEDYAEAWANAMEVKLEEGRAFDDVTQACADEVDRRPGFGITGFMYGMAVQLLSKMWAHGEELRKWHNLDCDPEQGKEANERGTVINPAILHMAPKEVE